MDDGSLRIQPGLIGLDFTGEDFLLIEITSAIRIIESGNIGTIGMQKIHLTWTMILPWKL
jgi:hypothetical protein